MIMARIAPIVKEQLNPDQAGFQPGCSICDQLLNLTQYIEDEYKRKQSTGTVFVDLPPAYDTVNHKTLLLKAAQMIRNKKIVSTIQSLLENRRFFVELDGRKRRWRNQQNVLPQWSVLAPTLFNIYILMTNRNLTTSTDSSMQMTSVLLHSQHHSLLSKRD